MEQSLWKIKQFNIDGLLGSHDIYWHLSPTVNILGAPNGAGKSTVLHALYLLLANPASRKDHYYKEAFFKSITAELESGTLLSLTRDSKENFEYSVTPAPIKEDPVDNAANVIYINSADITVRSVVDMRVNDREERLLSATVLDTLVKNELNRRNEFFYRRVSPAMLNGKDDEVKRLQDLFGRFEKTLKIFMPQYILVDSPSLIFELENRREEKTPYYRLSTGEKQLIYLLLTVSNTLEESTILLLDEADLGMHIDWKEILLRELLNINPNMQIIAATHSPSLVMGWQDKVKDISQLYITKEKIES